MNLYEVVKTCAIVSETAWKYGLEIKCHHKGVCPFYDDHYSMKSFANIVSRYAGSFRLIPDGSILIGKGKRCRGYRGIEVIDHDNPFL